MTHEVKTQRQFVAALQRAAQALAEAEALWADHPDTLDALVLDAPKSPIAVSFDEFVADFGDWVRALAERAPAQRPADRSGWVCLRTETGDRARHLAALAPPFGPGWPRRIVRRLTHLEIWGTTPESPDDACEFRGYAGSRRIATRYLPGY